MGIGALGFPVLVRRSGDNELEMQWEAPMRAMSVTGELLSGMGRRYTARRQDRYPTGAATRPAPTTTELVTHDAIVDGHAVSVVIERPEIDRGGGTWRCRIRVVRGDTRLERSQVVGISSQEVLGQAIDLAANRLGISRSDLLAGASVGSPVRTAGRSG